MTEEQYEFEQSLVLDRWGTTADLTLENIAIVKSYAYIQEYNPVSGRTEDKRGSLYLKDGYVDGFLAGVAYQFTGDSND